MRLQKKYIFILLTCFCFISASIFNTINAKEKITIVIDPGHGGKDQGTSTGNIFEKDIALNISQKLGQLLQGNENHNLNIVYTRNDDSFIPLYKRAFIANSNNGDIFISLHVNNCPQEYIHGAETYIVGVNGSNQTFEVAKLENSVMLLEDDYTNKYNGFNPNSSESYIMFELLQDEFLELSANLATSIQNSLKSTASLGDRGVKQAGFWILQQTNMPSVLVETGFLSNTKEAKYLISEKGQATIANSLYVAILKYLQMLNDDQDRNIQK